ncbi:MAG: DUF305 domain-containing protein [Lachnospiraceae bacterium]|nr:DUF305 domain-containing protein [Lachnospiraceae bacterium]
MNNQQALSNVTEKYLSRFYEILEEMIHGMTCAELTDSISHNFIVQMIPHHMAAIEMSRNLLKYTTFIPLQEIASNIITEQTKSIDDMKRVLDCCGGLQNSRKELQTYYKYYDRITTEMFCEMKNAVSTNNINENFMREMIPHHQGAVRMSENALCFTICPQLRPILDAIIKSQKKGIRQMECLLCNITNASCK